MKKEKVQLIFNKELSKINYDVIGSLTDLKLHLIAMEENCDDELFSMFCQQEYDLFTEELEVKMKHVGRTSKFRIDYENGLYGNVYYYDDFVNASKKEKMKMLFEEFVYSECLYDIFLEDNETEESYVQERIESYVGDLKTIVDTYKEIEDFKDCQIELWNEFIEEI